MTRCTCSEYQLYQVGCDCAAGREPAGRLAIWYMKPEWFREGIMGVGRPDPADLAATHIFLTTFEAQEGQPIDHALEDVFLHFQAEVWSPNGEARALIERKGLGHTSMSVGDVAVTGDGKVFVVARFGFEPLEAGR